MPSDRTPRQSGQRLQMMHDDDAFSETTRRPLRAHITRSQPASHRDACRSVCIRCNRKIRDWNLTLLYSSRRLNAIAIPGLETGGRNKANGIRASISIQFVCIMHFLCVLTHRRSWRSFEHASDERVCVCVFVERSILHNDLY